MAMMRPLTLPIAIIVVMGCALPGLAGIYDPAKPVLDVAEELPFEMFLDRRADQLRIGIAKTKENEAGTAALAVLKQKPDPSPVELVRRGILELKLRETEAALTDLNLAYRRDSNSFWAFAARGTALQQTGQFEEAVENLEIAKGLMPQPWPISAEATAVKRDEAAQLKLARLRQHEQAGRGNRVASRELDALFDVKFVGSTGQYEARNIAPAELTKLPADAIATVQQLLFWLPDDARLYWLLGELYNAKGDLDSAFAAFDECVARYDAPDLRRHRQIVRDAIAARPAAPAPATWAPSSEQIILVAAVVIPVLFVLVYFQLRVVARRMRRRRNQT
ncbi:MAG: tetratricopeptide repeat protein [Gemmataceae bacterium]